MNQGALNRELISEPHLWRLALRIDESALHVVLFCTIEDNSLIYREIVLDKAAPDRLKALEAAVYENPLLLADFAKVDCVVETACFTIVPASITSDEVREKIMTRMFDGFDGEILANDLPGQNATVLMGLDAEMAGFLRRSFNNPRIHHHLAPLCRYFHGKSRLGNTCKMYAYMRHDRMDVMAFGKDTLSLANTFTYRDPMDAVYYILSCRKMLGLDAVSDELFLSGDNASREAVTPVLRKYIGCVMPVIFPSSMFKAGKDSMNAPFDLIVLPLCE